MTCVEGKGGEERDTDDRESGRKGDGRHFGWSYGMIGEMFEEESRFSL